MATEIRLLVFVAGGVVSGVSVDGDADRRIRVVTADADVDGIDEMHLSEIGGNPYRLEEVHPDHGAIPDRLVREAFAEVDLT